MFQNLMEIRSCVYLHFVKGNLCKSKDNGDLLLGLFVANTKDNSHVLDVCTRGKNCKQSLDR